MELKEVKERLLKIENISGANTFNCTNCGAINVFKRKPVKPVSNEIAGYCKSCGHVVWNNSIDAKWISTISQTPSELK